METRATLLFLVLKLSEIGATLRLSSRLNLNSPQFDFQFQNISNFGFVRNFDSQRRVTYPQLSQLHVSQTFTPPQGENQQLYAGQGPGLPEQHQFLERGFPYQKPLPVPVVSYPPYFEVDATSPFFPNNPYTTNTALIPSVETTPPFSFPQLYIPPPPYSAHFPLPPPPKPSPFRDGFDIGFLPMQVRVPGVIRLNVIGRDVEITCEFPKYLILIQGIYWHHKYSHDPFGSYFDTQNGFGRPVHTTVRQVNQWKSILIIPNYVVDDYGMYRCISSAVLPAEMETTPDTSSPVSSPLLPSKKNYQHASRLNPPANVREEMIPMSYSFHPYKPTIPPSPESNIEITSQENKPPTFRYTKNSRKMIFPHISDSDTKARVKRDLSSDTTKRTENDASAEETRNYYNLLPTTLYDYPKFSYSRLTNPYANLFNNKLDNPIQDERHLSHNSWSGYAGALGFGINVPYYKPSFSYSTVYQEIKFDQSEQFRKHRSIKQ